MGQSDRGGTAGRFPAEVAAGALRLGGLQPICLRVALLLLGDFFFFYYYYFEEGR